MDLMVAATYDNIMMVEGEMDEVSEARLTGCNESSSRCNQNSLQSTDGVDGRGWKTVKREYNHEVNDEELRKAVRDTCYEKAYAVAASGNKTNERFDAFEAIREEFKSSIYRRRTGRKGCVNRPLLPM